MTPYYAQDGITIYNCEALAALNELALSDVAVVVADPPYSSGGMFRSDRAVPTGEKYRGWSHSPNETRPPAKSYGSFSGDSRDQRSYLTWCSLWLSALWAKAKPTAQAFVCTDWRQLPTTTDAVQAGGWTWRGLCVWDKGVGRPMRGRFRNHLEYIVWASHGEMPEAADIYPSTLLKHAPPSSDREHVTQKPVTLIKELMSIAPDGLLVDPFMGVGTSLVAAKDAGRAAVGIEIEERYCEIAANRLQQNVLPLHEPHCLSISKEATASQASLIEV
jgi:site-specific DNA-methyltransferase (adenine-specific)